MMSGPGRRTWVVTTLAQYQTVFWAGVARELIAAGQPVVLFAFDDRSSEILDRRGIPCTNIHSLGLELTKNLDFEVAFDEVMQADGIDSPNLFISHERHAFSVRNSKALRRKYVIYSTALKHELTRLQRQGHSPVLVQELGGFLSVVASYFAARAAGIDNWFIEPSFFRGRYFLLKNSFAAAEIPLRGAPIGASVATYLEDTKRARAIVIPKKDRGHYRPALAKLSNLHNIRRFGEKLFDKVVLRKHQDFGYVGAQVVSHVRMALNSYKLRRYYTALERVGPFVYFPLHVPADVALTLRAPEYLDQLSLVDYLLRHTPASHALVIKEHPAQIGATDVTRLRSLMDRYDNLVVLPPSTNNYRVLERADAVVCVNSKTGAEALLLGKPVVVLGDAFYSRTSLVRRIDRLGDVGPALLAALTAKAADSEAVDSFFQAVWDTSYPGELYVNDGSNIAQMASSLRSGIERI